MGFSLLAVALRNLKRKAFRTSVLILSIALLVSLMVFGTSFVMSVSSSLEKASNRLGADLLVVPVGARDFAEEVLLETKTKTFYMDKALIDRVRKIEGIEEITYQTYLSSILGICCDIPAVKIVAFDQDTDFIVKPWLTKVLDRKLEKGEAIIGHQAYENYGLLDTDSSVFFNTKFEFVGVLDETGTGLDNAIFISEDNMSDIIHNSNLDIGENQISLIFTKVERGYDPYEVGRDVEGEILEVDVVARNDIGKKIISTLTDIKKVFIITIVLASLLSAFLAWTVFSTIVNERFMEIGLMKAMGAKGSHIVKMFVLEVFTLGLLGSILGIMLGTYMSMEMSGIFELIREMSISLNLVERAEIGFLGFVVGTGICLIGSLSCIFRLRKLDILSALKGECAVTASE